MTKDKSKSTKWNKELEEYLQAMKEDYFRKYIQNKIDKWDGKDGKAKDEVLVNIVCQHARMNNAELPPPKKTDTFESNDMQRYCKSTVMSADPHKRTQQMRDFTAFAIKNYGLAIQYHDDNDILPDVRKLSNKDFGF
jgi:hypothetical protein